MSNKLKCLFCGEELGGNMAEPCCRNRNCEMNAIPIPRTIWEKLIQNQEELNDYKHNYSVKSEQHERGYAYATKTIKDLESKLKIARKALEDINVLLLSHKFDITELGRLNIIQHLVSRALKATDRT